MTDLLGRTIGPYQLVEAIDETGAALVYKGFQPSMNRYVALKVLKPGAARDPAIMQAFMQTGELAAQIQHPNILPVYDSGQAEGVYYRATPFIESGSLRDNLGLFYEPRQALILIDGINQGLEAIYSRGYVHGNLKPTNILLDEQRRPLLSDFGLARHPGAAPTPYDSPEQVQGGVVDRRTDVYALGVLLYEVLVGEPPPSGVIASPRARRPDLPESIERVIFKAMAQNPDARFQSPAEFRNALDAALRPVAPPVQPAAPPPPSAGQPQAAPPPAKKGTNWLAIILGVALLAVLCLCVVLVGPRVLDYVAGRTPEPTQPIEVTVVLPTREERPTREPPPTEPEQPPTEPVEPPPTEPVEPPPTEPGEPPDATPPPGGGLPEVCGSVGFLGGAAILGGVVSANRRRKRS